MANIFSLYGSVFIDNEKANKSIDDTSSKGESMGSKVGKAMTSMAKGAAVVGTAVVAGASAAVGGLMSIANKSAETADTFDKSSLRTGLQVEYLQKLNYAAGQSGVQLGSLEKSAKKLNERIGEVSEGNKASIEMFNKLGVSVKNTDGTMRDSSDVYNETMMKLADMGDTAEATAIGTDLFGKAFVDMKPLLAAGSDGIGDLMGRADELGIVMSEDAVSAGVKFGDTVADIKSALGGAANTLGSAVTPLLQGFADMIIAAIPTIRDIISSLVPVLIQMAQAILPPMMNLIQTIMPILVDLFNQLMPFITQVIQAILPILIQLIEILLPPIIQIVQMILPLLLQLIEPLLPLLEPILNLLQPFINLLVMILEPLTKLLNLILPPIIQLLSSLLGFILPPLQAAFQAVASVLGGAFQGAFEGISNTLGWVIDIFKNIIDFVKNVFTGNWEGVWENVTNIFSNIISGIANIFKTPINWIIDGINAFIGGINSIKIPDWVPLVGGMGFHINTLSRLRIGIDDVPYDEFPALLHKHEAVLTESENKEYKSLKQEATNNQTMQPINSVQEINISSKDEEVVKLVEQLIKQLPREIKEAIKGLTGKVVMDKEIFGHFIIDTMEREVFE